MRRPPNESENPAVACSATGRETIRGKESGDCIRSIFYLEPPCFLLNPRSKISLHGLGYTNKEKHLDS
jgi:hypothetical protein